MTSRLAAVGNDAVERHRRAWPTVRAVPALHMHGAINMVFGATGNDHGLLGSGWSGPEPGYCWTVGRLSSMTLPRPRPAKTPDAYRIEIELAPFTGGDRLPRQRIVTTINGWRAPSQTLDQLSVLEYLVPTEVIEGLPAIEIVVEAPDAARPCDLIGSNDDRQLGFSFRRLRVTSIAPAIASQLALGGTIDDGLDDTALMYRFESLGENCEFGLVQRRAGAEPLGLLRFASAPLSHLLPALASGFAGIGAPGRVTVALAENGQEHMVHDQAYDFLYHAGDGPDADPARLAAREAIRLPFLADKLMADLRTAEKIFVFHPVRDTPRAGADLLAAAIAEHGKAQLLWVEPATDEFPCGTARRLSETLLIGHLAHFAPADNASDFDYDGWRRLCRACLVASAEHSSTGTFGTDT